ALFLATTPFFFLRAGAAFFLVFLVFDFAFFAFFAMIASRSLRLRFLDSTTPLSHRHRGGLAHRVGHPPPCAPRVRGLRSPSRSARRCGRPGSPCPQRSASCSRYCRQRSRRALAFRYSRLCARATSSQAPAGECCKCRPNHSRDVPPLHLSRRTQ